MKTNIYPENNTQINILFNRNVVMAVDKTRNTDINSVLLVADLRTKLISVKKTIVKRFDVVFKKNKTFLVSTEEIIKMMHTEL